jgi:polysaccharide biosynthesis/export protein
MDCLKTCRFRSAGAPKWGTTMLTQLRLLAPALIACLATACSLSSLIAFAADAPQTVPAGESKAPKSQVASAAKVAASYTSMSDPDSKAYKIGPQDILEISVFKVPELSKTIQVSESGTLNFPLIGETQVSGKTAREVEQDLSKRLGARYLQKPQITVFIKEHNSQRVTLDGAVKKPGVYPVAGGLSLLQIVAQGGGFDQNADETVLLFRQVDGKRSVAKYDVSDIRTGKAKDIQLLAGDVIVAPTSDLKEGMNTMFKFLPLATLIPLL